MGSVSQGDGDGIINQNFPSNWIPSRLDGRILMDGWATAAVSGGGTARGEVGRSASGARLTWE